jgi:hypothetical protein
MDEFFGVDKIAAISAESKEKKRIQKDNEDSK